MMFRMLQRLHFYTISKSFGQIIWDKAWNMVCVDFYNVCISWASSLLKHA